MFKNIGLLHFSKNYSFSVCVFVDKYIKQKKFKKLYHGIIHLFIIYLHVKFQLDKSIRIENFEAEVRIQINWQLPSSIKWIISLKMIQMF